MEKSQEIDFLATLLPLSLVLFIIVLGVLVLNQQFNKKLYRQKLEAEQLKLRHQQELLRTSIRVQEEERRLIARNLHDELGAVLSMTRMQVMQLERQTGEEWHAPLNKVRELTEVALASMRRISHELIPPQLEAFGLLKTLEAVANQFDSMEHDLKIEAPEDLPRLALAEELGLYRICMELINNTLKHANATQIVISLSLKAGDFQIVYTDNGVGLPEDQSGEGLGHKNIEARIHAMGGSVRIDNHPPSGMRAVMRIPLTSSHTQ